MYLYASIILRCEELENKGVYRGNGHHLAQNLCVDIQEGLLSKQQRKIYDVLTKSPASVKEISTKCKMSSRQTSAQLNQINDRYGLISFKRIGKNKLWYHNK